MKGMVEFGPGGAAEAGILPAMLHPEDVSEGQVMRAWVITAPATASSGLISLVVVSCSAGS